MKKLALVLAMLAFVVSSVYASYSVSDMNDSAKTENVVKSASDDFGTPQDNPKKDCKGKTTDCSKTKTTDCKETKKSDCSKTTPCCPKTKKTCCDKNKTK